MAKLHQTLVLSTILALLVLTSDCNPSLERLGLAESSIVRALAPEATDQLEFLRESDSAQGIIHGNNHGTFREAVAADGTVQVVGSDENTGSDAILRTLLSRKSLLDLVFRSELDEDAQYHTDSYLLRGFGLREPKSESPTSSIDLTGGPLPVYRPVSPSEQEKSNLPFSSPRSNRTDGTTQKSSLRAFIPNGVWECQERYGWYAMTKSLGSKIESFHQVLMVMRRRPKSTSGATDDDPDSCSLYRLALLALDGIICKNLGITSSSPSSSTSSCLPPDWRAAMKLTFFAPFSRIYKKAYGDSATLVDQSVDAGGQAGLVKESLKEEERIREEEWTRMASGESAGASSESLEEQARMQSTLTKTNKAMQAHFEEHGCNFARTANGVRGLVKCLFDPRDWRWHQEFSSGDSSHSSAINSPVTRDWITTLSETMRKHPFYIWENGGSGNLQDLWFGQFLGKEADVEEVHVKKSEANPNRNLTPSEKRKLGSKLFDDMLLVIRELQRLNILHRDFKPANVVFRPGDSNYRSVTEESLRDSSDSASSTSLSQSGNATYSLIDYGSTVGYEQLPGEEVRFWNRDKRHPFYDQGHWDRFCWHPPFLTFNTESNIMPVGIREKARMRRQEERQKSGGSVSGAQPELEENEEDEDSADDDPVGTKPGFLQRVWEQTLGGDLGNMEDWSVDLELFIAILGSIDRSVFFLRNFHMDEHLPSAWFSREANEKEEQLRRERMENETVLDSRNEISTMKERNSAARNMLLVKNWNYWSFALTVVRPIFKYWTTVPFRDMQSQMLVNKELVVKRGESAKNPSDIKLPPHTSFMELCHTAYFGAKLGWRFEKYVNAVLDHHGTEWFKPVQLHFLKKILTDSRWKYGDFFENGWRDTGAGIQEGGVWADSKKGDNGMKDSVSDSYDKIGKIGLHTSTASLHDVIVRPGNITLHYKHSSTYAREKESKSEFNREWWKETKLPWWEAIKLYMPGEG